MEDVGRHDLDLLTEHDETLDELHQRTEQLEQLAGGTEVGLFLRTPTDMLYMNDSLFRIFGYDITESRPDVGDIWGIIDPQDYEEAARITATADGGQSATGEIRIIHPGNVVRWIRATNDPVLADDGTIRVAGTIIDITDRKEAEAAMRAAQLEAEHANAAKDEFLSRMSHELRTPLNAILGFTQLLQRDEPTSTQIEMLHHIMRGGEHLLEMINDLLDIASIESGHLSMSVEQVVLSFDPTPQGEEIYARTDRRRLKQVVLNLLSNAIKYNRQGGAVTLTISVSAEDSAQGKVRLNVSDTGLGIAAEDLSKLFSPFERLGKQTTDIEGAGIGLALSQRLVTMMGGTLGVESVLGQGSTFSVTLPLTAEPQILVSSDYPGSLTMPDGRTTATLVYIEDTVSNVELLRGVVRLAPGWQLSHASTGQEGLDIAFTTAPTAILLDMHLPDLDGLDVLRALQLHPVTAKVPIAILSADASPRQIGRMLTAGASKYLTKPIDIDSVLSFLHSCVN
jgi:PAS domain S-box-containing protein